jgi:hypothetical protein
MKTVVMILSKTILTGTGISCVQLLPLHQPERLEGTDGIWENMVSQIRTISTGKN